MTYDAIEMMVNTEIKCVQISGGLFYSNPDRFSEITICALS